MASDMSRVNGYEKHKITSNIGSTKGHVETSATIVPSAFQLHF